MSDGAAARDGERLVRPEIATLPPYRAGVDAGAIGPGVARLDSNEAPWPPFPDAVEAMGRALRDLNRYPEIGSRDVIAALAACHGVPAERIVVGSGSGSLIRALGLVLLRPGDEVVVAEPSYPPYGLTAALMGARVRGVPVADGAPDLEAMLAAVTPRTRLVFVASPHNPTGGIVRRAPLERYLERVPAHLVTVLDEAYHEFVADPGYADGRAYLDAGKPVVVLRTMSKAYGLAGLRVGYGFATGEIRDALERARENFPLSTLGQVAAVASLPRQDLVRERARVVVAERARLGALCDGLGLRRTPSEGNFLFLDVRRDARAVVAALRRRAVLVRSGHVHGMPSWIRVSLGLPADGDRFAAALAEALAEVPESAAGPEPAR
jgi:histidinol-phosphate aminotransferase